MEQGKTTEAESETIRRGTLNEQMCVLQEHYDCLIDDIKDALLTKAPSDIVDHLIVALAFVICQIKDLAKAEKKTKAEDKQYEPKKGKEQLPKPSKQSDCNRRLLLAIFDEKTR